MLWIKVPEILFMPMFWILQQTEAATRGGQVFKNTFTATSGYNCFLIKYKHNNTKIIYIDIKHNYILYHSIQFSKQMLLFIAVGCNIQK